MQRYGYLLPVKEILHSEAAPLESSVCRPYPGYLKLNTFPMIQEDEFTDNSGHKFYSRSWIPKEEPVATVYFCHGLGEHTGRYDTLFEKFNEANIRVHSFDSRGYGRTVKLNGQEGDIGGYSMVEKDITAFIDRFPSDTPKILVHSTLDN